MKKAIAIVLLVLFVFVGVRATTLAENEPIFLVTSAYNDRITDYYIATIRDTITGVEYIYVCQSTLGGVAISFTPRYNVDGSLFTGK